jgi:hypothetical protein
MQGAAEMLAYGTAGVGKMAGSPEEDVTAAKSILQLSAKGHFFNQTWAHILNALFIRIKLLLFHLKRII